jgi:hypothetical protein
MIKAGEWGDHVQAMGIDFQRGRDGSRPQWLHQMRSDLGRLDAIAEILQVGPVLGPGAQEWEPVLGKDSAQAKR